MAMLKNGSEVEDVRLARLVEFDERSRSYPVREILPKAKARSYTWRCDTFLDQGTEGSCVGMAMAHELIARPVCVDTDLEFAREQIYWEAQKIDPWEGGSYPGADPQYEGTSVLAGIKVLKRLGFIDEYRWAFSLDDLIRAVGYRGPAILGLPWYEGMFDVKPCGCIHPYGRVVGGHAVCCNGVSIVRETFTIHNSWGKGWGNNGTAEITWAEMDRLLHEAGEAVIPVVRGWGDDE